MKHVRSMSASAPAPANALEERQACMKAARGHPLGDAGVRQSGGQPSQDSLQRMIDDAVSQHVGAPPWAP